MLTFLTCFEAKTNGGLLSGFWSGVQGSLWCLFCDSFFSLVNAKPPFFCLTFSFLLEKLLHESRCSKRHWPPYNVKEKAKWTTEADPEPWDSPASAPSLVLPITCALLLAKGMTRPLLKPLFLGCSVTSSWAHPKLYKPQAFSIYWNSNHLSRPTPISHFSFPWDHTIAPSLMMLNFTGACDPREQRQLKNRCPPSLCTHFHTICVPGTSSPQETTSPYELDKTHDAQFTCDKIRHRPSKFPLLAP